MNVHSVAFPQLKAAGQQSACTGLALQATPASPPNPTRKSLRQGFFQVGRHTKLLIAPAQERLHLRVPLECLRKRGHLDLDAVCRAFVPALLEGLVPIAQLPPGFDEVVGSKRRVRSVPLLPPHPLDPASDVPRRSIIDHAHVTHERRPKVAGAVWPHAVQRHGGGVQSSALVRCHVQP